MARRRAMKPVSAWFWHTALGANRALGICYPAGATPVSNRSSPSAHPSEPPPSSGTAPRRPALARAPRAVERVLEELHELIAASPAGSGLPSVRGLVARFRGGPVTRLRAPPGPGGGGGGVARPGAGPVVRGA